MSTEQDWGLQDLCLQYGFSTKSKSEQLILKILTSAHLQSLQPAHVYLTHQHIRPLTNLHRDLLAYSH
ncbi:unnamed protein product [Paramecium octaurelia]|uniref:Uncharacterized protein n=1 Tax=Paramecium octaurelia TaxID=43137 RepID=A0A8S1SAH0_PAROT|nr:unnamed protein product [Paramecium octaurelia]